jgi:elongation factor G
MNPQDRVNIIQAQVPLAEILRYAIDLKSMTQGRGSFTMEFSHYQEVPAKYNRYHSKYAYGFRYWFRIK